MTRLVILVLILISHCWASEQRITIPTAANVEQLSNEDHKALELLLNMPVIDAIREGYLTPGTIVDFNSPGIAFTRDFNLWLNKREELARLYGVDTFRISDVQELVLFENMQESWQAYCDLIENAYQVHKKNRQQMKRLRKEFYQNKKYAQ